MEKSEKQIQMEQELTTVGVSQAVAEFLSTPERNNKVLNNEGLMVGDMFSITGVDDQVAEYVNAETGKSNFGVRLLCAGDVASITPNTLSGTRKVDKHFVNPHPAGTYATFPRKERELVLSVARGDYKGKVFRVMDIAEDVQAWKPRAGQDGKATFYLFEEVK